jgi:hypothetical protein
MVKYSIKQKEYNCKCVYYHRNEIIISSQENQNQNNILFILMYLKGIDISKAARERSTLLRGPRAMVCPP